MTLLTWYRTVAVCSLCAALGLQAYWVLSAPGATLNPLGLRGLQRVRMLRKSSLVAAVEPLLRWLGVRLSAVLNQRVRDAVDRRLELAGYYLGLWPEEFLALCLLSALAAAGGGLFHSLVNGASGLYPVLAVTLGAALPVLALAEAQAERTKQITRLLPAVMDLLVLALSAGLDFRGALQQVVDKTSRPEHPLIEELGFVLHELQMGKTRSHALRQLVSRTAAADLHDFVNTVIQAEERGNPLARVLQIQADVARQRRTVRAEEAAAKAAVKMMLPMLLVFGAVLLLIAAPMVLSLGSTFKGS